MEKLGLKEGFFKKVLKPEDDHQKLRSYAFAAGAIIAIVLTLFSVFQGYTGVLPEIRLRSVHLGFIIVLALLLYPPSAKLKDSKLFFCFDLVLITLSIASMVYLYVIYPNLSQHAGARVMADVVFGMILIIMLLEATRRTLGLSIPIIAIAFLSYIFLGPYFPGVLAHGGFDLYRAVPYLFITTEGIFSAPLAASAKFIVLFVFFGALLNVGGGIKFFTDVAFGLLGHMRGGPAKVAVMASALFGTISGSASANVMVTGQLTIPLMRRHGFAPHVAAAIETVASAGGQLMPPVMGAAAFIMAELLGRSYWDIVIAALIPAILYFAAIYAAVDLESKKNDLKGLSRADLPNLKSAFMKGYHFLIPIAVLLFCLGYLRLSAQYSIVWSIFVLILAMVVKRTVDEKFTLIELFVALREGSLMVIPIALACAAAGLIIGSFTLTGLALKIGGWLVSLAGGNLFLLLFITMITSLMLGMGLPTAAAYVLLATLVVPAMVQIGADALAAHMFVFYFGVISAMTPPVCVAAFAAASFTGDHPFKVGLTATRLGIAAYIIPYMFVFGPALIMKGGFVKVLIAAVTALIGIVSLAAGVVGFLSTKLNIIERFVLIAAAIALMSPSILISVLGIVVFAAMLIKQNLQQKKNQSVQV